MAANKVALRFVEGEAIPPPITEVSQVGFHRNLLKEASIRGLNSPLNLQKSMWPVVIRGRSVVCVSKHNSGKTVGYILPLVSCIIETQEQAKQRANEYGPIALILVSSSQTAKRIGKICRLMASSSSNVNCVVLHSEVSERVVYCQLLNGCSILVATPQAFLKALLMPDRHRYTFTNLRRIAHLVIDDAEILLSKCRDSMEKVLSEISVAMREGQSKGAPSNGVQFIVTGSEWTSEVDEFFQSLAPYQPILIKSTGAVSTNSK